MWAFVHSAKRDMLWVGPVQLTTSAELAIGTEVYTKVGHRLS